MQVGHHCIQQIFLLLLELELLQNLHHDNVVYNMQFTREGPDRNFSVVTPIEET